MNPDGVPSPQTSPDYNRPPEHTDPLLPPPFGQAQRINSVYVLFILMMAAMAVVGGILQYFFGFVVNAIVTEIAVVMLPIVMLLRRNNPMKALKLVRPPSSSHLFWGVAGVLGLAIILAEYGFWADRVFPMPEIFKEAYLAAITPHSFPELILFVFVAGLIPGLCEEIAFRGYFLQVFRSRHGAYAGIFIAAALFAIMHLDPWHLIALFIIGAYLGFLFYWTGSLWVPIAAHFTNNAASVIMVYAMPNASVSQMDQPPPLPLLLASCAIFATAIIWLRRNAQDSTLSTGERAIHD